MFTPPADLAEPALRAALADGWSLHATTLAYRPVGFGSHHWDLTDPAGTRYFVTVDDLRTRRHTPGEPLAACYHRLHAALAVAQALRAAGNQFVLAPLPAREGEPLTPLADAFALAVYPFVTGPAGATEATGATDPANAAGGTEAVGEGGDDFTEQDRHAVLDLLVAVHAAPPQVRDRARTDDYTIPFRGTISGYQGDPTRGPYAQPAADLLTAHGPAIHDALKRYDSLVEAVSPGVVLTHGEPHPGNVIRTGEGLVLIDWDTALAAPPERDLWDLDAGDGTVFAAYTAATGVVPRPGLVELYRLRWDLTEVAGCLAHFGEPHGTSADDEETWANLTESVTRL